MKGLPVSNKMEIKQPENRFSRWFFIKFAFKKLFFASDEQIYTTSFKFNVKGCQIQITFVSS